MGNTSRDPQKFLEDTFGVEVHFQPPSGIFLSYPCVLYELSDIYTKKADDTNYVKINRYTLTLIDRDPDSNLVDVAMNNLPMVSFDRSYQSNDLNHWVFSFYY